MDDVRYPIGKVEHVPYSEDEHVRRANHIKHLPSLLESVVQGLTEEDLQQPYREGGWTIHQLVHHVADSHMQGFVRIKMALTMDRPTISFYDQDAFVQQPDVLLVPINHSITLLHALHARWYELVKLRERGTGNGELIDQSLALGTWHKEVYHPEQQRWLSAWELLGIYSWHGRHHATQIMRWRERNAR